MRGNKNVSLKRVKSNERRRRRDRKKKPKSVLAMQWSYEKLLDQKTNQNYNKKFIIPFFKASCTFLRLFVAS